MTQETLQFIYIMGAIILNLSAMLALFAKQTRRVTRIETYLAQCCKALDIHTGEL